MSVNTTSDIFHEYVNVFEGIGCLDGSYHIEIVSTVKPVIHPPRRVPVTLKDNLKKELVRMVEEGILAPVNDLTDWVSRLGMVTVVKPNKLRICIDPKDLNRAIKISDYPMPTIEEVATKLGNEKVFSVLDAKSGFWQMRLDEESSMLTTFNTPFGREFRQKMGLQTRNIVFALSASQRKSRECGKNSKNDPKKGATRQTRPLFGLTNLENYCH